MIYCDNKLSTDLVNTARLKLNTKLCHVDIHQHWMREHAQDGDIMFEWKPTTELPANGMTKRLGKRQHGRFVRLVGMVDLTTRTRSREISGGEDLPRMPLAYVPRPAYRYIYIYCLFFVIFFDILLVLPIFRAGIYDKKKK